MLENALAGRLVLDLSQYIPGPFATMMLANYGARVIKIEPPQGDPMRSFGPLGPDGIAYFYKQLNADKEIIKLDLKSPEGKEQFFELVKSSAVVLESFRPGVMDRLGCGYERLKELNPGLVYCALSGFGQSGPLRLAAGHDMTYVALTGGLAGNGIKERPLPISPPLADHAGAMQAVCAILAGLLSGKACYLDISLYEAALNWQYMNCPPGGFAEREDGLLNGGAAYYRIYETRDGRFAAFAPIEEKFWQSFCKAAGRDDLADRQGEPFPQTALIAELDALFKSKGLAEWEALLGPADCCFQAVLTPDEALNHPQLQARGVPRHMRTDAYMCTL